MAVGTKSDFIIYHDEVYGGWLEELAQNVNVFNAASKGTIKLITENMLGDYNKKSFFDRISNLVQRRDTTSTSDATALKMTQGEIIGVKLNRRIGPVDQTLDSWEKVGFQGEDAQREMSYLLGRHIAEDMAEDMVETSIRCVEAALSGQSDNTYDATGQTTKTLTVTHLASGLAKMGDAANKVICWVMHSKVYWDLVKQAISDKIYEEAGVVVYGGTPGTLGRPVVVTDADALNVGANSNTGTYQTLGLVADGCVITESETKRLVDEVVTGKNNLLFRIQGEFAFNVMMKGFKYDISNGGENPTNTSLRTASNWDKEYASKKNLCGIRIVTQ